MTGVLLRDELVGLIRTWSSVPLSLDDDTSLIASGLLDSLALFNLILWIEQKTGRSIEPTSVNPVAEWDSVTRILQYVQDSSVVRQSGAAMPSSAAASYDRHLPEREYRVVRYTPDHKHAVAEFQTGLWSRTPSRNLQYLEWKYEQNPYANEGRIYLAFHNDLLVGMRGFYGSRWEGGVPTRQMPVLVADDLLVGEHHRNRGLVTHIMQTAFEDLRDSGARFVLNLSGATLTVLNSLAMGWKTVGRARPMNRRPVGLVPLRVQRLFSKERPPFTRFDRAAVGETQPRPDAMARLIQRIGYDGRLRHVRDRSYFDWRFRNPFREYRFLYAGDEELDGYLVLTREKNSQTVGIVDLEAINGRVRAGLLKAAVTGGAFRDVGIWTSTADTQMLEQLAALKFEPPDSQPAALGQPFLIRMIDLNPPEEAWRLEGGRQLLEASNWDFRMLYSMAG
ncbi:MAG: GNAT family N-acetyltransferase [Vicinamibacterales bacterium]